MRFSAPVSTARRAFLPPGPVAYSTELRASRNSFWDSSSGRSWATAIIIPKTVETRPSTVRPSRVTIEAPPVELRTRARGRRRRPRRLVFCAGGPPCEGGRPARAKPASDFGVASQGAAAEKFGRPRKGITASPNEGESLALAAVRKTSSDPSKTAEFLERNAVDSLPRGRAGAKARARRRGGAAAAGEARHRSHGARHPPRTHGRAAEAARVPGRRPRRGADHRRLHRQGGGPVRALRAAARARPRGDRPQRRHLPGAGVQGARPRAHRGAAQRRVARHADGRPLPPRAHGDARARDRARRLLEAARARTSRSHCSSCSTRCCRATTRWR